MGYNFPPAQDICFIDANVLYYSVVALPGVSDYCSALMIEIANGTRRAATISSAVADAVHKVMFTEIVEVHHRPRAGLLAWVKKNPQAIASLTKFATAAQQFSVLPLTWLPTGPAALQHAATVALQNGLTVNDALIVAAMRDNDIQHLITNDQDFQHVSRITVWKPS